jgi:hypothetical protein
MRYWGSEWSQSRSVEVSLGQSRGQPRESLVERACRDSLSRGQPPRLVTLILATERTVVARALGLHLTPTPTPTRPGLGPKHQMTSYEVNLTFPDSGSLEYGMGRSAVASRRVESTLLTVRSRKAEQ